jgi:hypothetical protein
MIWSPFHYSGQTLGVGMLYARRANFRVDRITRSAFAAFIYLTFLSQTAFAEVAPTGVLYFGVRLPTFGLAPAVPWFLRNAMYVCAAVALASLALGTFKQRRLPPVGLVLAPLAQYVWFVPGADVPGFRELVPAFHSLQYLVVAGAMHIGSMPAMTASQAASRVGRWMAINVAGGAALFALLPRLAKPFGYAEPLLAAGVITAGIQIHHFFVDGVIWKLRKRAVAVPLGALREGSDAVTAPMTAREAQVLA